MSHAPQAWWRWQITRLFKTSNLRRRGRDRQRYWKSVPLPSMMALLFAVFLTFSSIAFVSDLAEPRPSPYWWVLVYAANTGIISVGYALTSTRYVRFWPLTVAANLISIYALPKMLPLYAMKVPPGTLVAELHQRHLLDAMLVLAVLLLGYMFFFSFVSMEGTKYFRLRAEVELAEHVQAELVPPLHLTANDLEIFGKSVPSSTVGGDLVDAVVFDGSLTCYLADVSGHGIQASVLMSMVKSAVRTSVSQCESLVKLMDHLNEALFHLKEPN
ncbi:MAG TPA: SpoIIE family protein phosphatase, partial [Terriglobales bacterium]